MTNDFKEIYQAFQNLTENELFNNLWKFGFDDKEKEEIKYIIHNLTNKTSDNVSDIQKNCIKYMFIVLIDNKISSLKSQIELLKALKFDVHYIK